MSYGNKSLDDMMQEVREVNTANGWLDEDRSFGDDFAVLHSKVSEVYEGWRKGYTANAAEEAADIFICLLDACDRNSIDLHAEYVRMLETNRHRGYRHGGKRV